MTSVGLMQSVLLRSEPLPEGTPVVRGHDFEKGRDLDAVMEAMLNSGFQATNMGEAVGLVNEMVRPQLHICHSTEVIYVLAPPLCRYGDSITASI